MSVTVAWIENYSNELFQVAKFFERKGFEVTGIWGNTDDYGCNDSNLAGLNLTSDSTEIYLSIDKSKVNIDEDELRLGSKLSIFELLPLLKELEEFVSKIWYFILYYIIEKYTKRGIKYEDRKNWGKAQNMGNWKAV